MSLASRSRRASGFVCKACSRRAIATDASKSSTIPPESPRFIDVPQPPQRFLVKEKRVRGKLPVPRNLFPNGTVEKASPLWLDAVTPEPKNRGVHYDKDLEAIQSRHLVKGQWNRRMAERRRTNLRQGVLEMHKRESDVRQAAEQRAQKAKVQRAEIANRPSRTDEVFTGQSITEALREVYKRDQLRSKDDIAQKQANHAARLARRKEQQADAIHTLYMHARNFVTTEQGLDEAIQKAFHHEEDGRPKLESIWGAVEDSSSAPMTTAEMLQRSHGVGTESSTLRTAVTTNRMKRLAEALTGGKMDST